MPLNREQFLKKRASQKLVSVDLPDGDQALLKPVSAKLYREYKRSCRDKDNFPIPERSAYSDEILVAFLLVDESGQSMFTVEQVLEGVFDEIDQPVLTALVRKSYELIGLSEPDDEDREKNLSGTASTEQS